MIRQPPEKPKADSMERQNTGQQPVEGGCLRKGYREIVDPGASTQAVFQNQQPDSKKTTDADPIVTWFLTRSSLIENTLDTIKPNEKRPQNNHPKFSSLGYIPNEATTCPWVTFLYELTGTPRSKMHLGHQLIMTAGSAILVKER